MDYGYMIIDNYHKIQCDKSTQTEDKELEKLKSDNMKLLNDIKEISKIISVMAKINEKDVDIDTIKKKLTVLVNREIRMHHAIPFINIDSIGKMKMNRIDL